MSESPPNRPLRVLVAHNVYQQRGGEDAVVEAEVKLLRDHGHEVIEYLRFNDDIAQLSPTAAAGQTLWSQRTRREIALELSRQRIDLVHCHNTFPLISPSIYWAADAAKIALVQTLHNFRLLCPQAMFLRDGRVCEDCLGHLPWRAVVHGCYRGSRLQSSVVVGMLGLHRSLGTYRDKVTLYIALNEFCRRKFIEGGLPAERIRIKPNFVEGPAVPGRSAREGFLFVGRLSPEKGVDLLVQAAQRMPQLPVRVAGTGPLQGLLQQATSVTPLGRLAANEVFDEMARARALVLPSVCYESFPRTLVEAYASGLPVIASRMGPMIELVEHGVTGLLFDPGDVDDLVRVLGWAQTHRDEMASMGESARKVYERHLNADANYGQLLGIYRDAVARQRSDPPHRS